MTLQDYLTSFDDDGQNEIVTMVVGLFSSIPEVVSIHQDLDEEEIVFWVFTSEKKYDDRLMDRLLSLEVKILKQLPKVSILFQYIPLVHTPEEKDIVSGTATTIFVRPDAYCVAQ